MSIHKALKDIEHPDELLNQVDDVLLLSLKDPAFQLSDAEGELLVPNPKGIYVKTHLAPVIAEGMPAREQSTGKLVDYENIMNINDGVCDLKGKLLISKEMMKNKHKTISLTGFYPVSAVHVLRATVDLNMKQFANHSRSLVNPNNAVAYIQEGNSDLLYEGYFDSYVRETLGQLHEFISKDHWRMYFTEIKKMNMYIKKSVDYRIWDWTTTQYAKLHPDEQY